MQGLEIILAQYQGDENRLGMTEKIRRDKWNEQMAEKREISNVVEQGQEQLVKDVFKTDH